MTNKPAILTLQYNYDTGSLPPPYHYEITLQVIGGQGNIRFLPDYPSEQTPVWEETFDIPQKKLESFLKFLQSKNVFTQNWQHEDQPVSGGELQRLEIELNKQKTLIPYDVSLNHKGKLADVFAAVRELLPDGLLHDLEKRQEEYQNNL